MREYHSLSEVGECVPQAEFLINKLLELMFSHKDIRTATIVDAIRRAVIVQDRNVQGMVGLTVAWLLANRHDESVKDVAPQAQIQIQRHYLRT